MRTRTHDVVDPATVEDLRALGERLDHRVDNLERLCFKLRDEKLDKRAVADEVLELLRKPRR